jgi:aspartyl-tRNA(Asn)/glutamyl-tRNA(Gln) amidotransferase subunit B
MSDTKYIPTIGLEIHAELKTNTKMFSNSRNNPDEEKPNTNINPVDVAHPGTLPTINKKAVEHMIKIGLAVGGEIADYTEFDRKNYFYPDIPKGYQISQFKYPIVSGGNVHGVDLTRIHLEEDTGLSKHFSASLETGDPEGFSLVDYNRAGIPLMELVTEPVIHSAEDASDFAKEFQTILRYLGVADANMEKGEMRVEANISVSDDPKKLGTKVEVKNLNSFKVVEKAINFEIKRMTKLLEEGRGDEIVQETRGFDESKQKTFSQRKKETSDDYRYFPEPDLPKMNLHEVFDLDSIKESLPELPKQKRERFTKEFGIKEADVELFIFERELSDFFESVVKQGDFKAEQAKIASNYILSDVVSLTKEGGEIPEVDSFTKLIDMITDDKVSSRVAKDILAILVKDKSIDPEKYAQENNIIQKDNSEELKPILESILENNPSVVEDYKKGKENALKFLMGQVMRETKGSANPKKVEEMLKELIS